MNPQQTKLLAAVTVILLAATAGYVSRRRGWVKEAAAGWLMTAVVVAGFSPIALLTVWKLELAPEHAWLPLLMSAHVLLMARIGGWVAPLLSDDRRERGMFTIACGLGNLSFTMGGAVAYVLYGEQGLGLVSIVGLMWTPMIAMVIYPIARHHQSDGAAAPVHRLVVRSLFDVRAIGLPMMLAGLALSWGGVERPGIIDRIRLIDAMMLVVVFTSYYAIGLRLRLGRVARLKRAILALATVRFAGGVAVGLGLWALTLATPWALHGRARNVFFIECFVPMAVTTVAVANMFHLRPKEASVLFIANTATYLLLLLPLVLWVFSTWLGAAA